MAPVRRKERDLIHIQIQEHLLEFRSLLDRRGERGIVYLDGLQLL